MSLSMTSRISLALLMLAPIAALLLWAASNQSGQLRARAEAAARAGLVNAAYGPLLLDLASPMVKGTRFEGRVNTGLPIQSDALNIVALPVQRAGLSELACNCAYLGSQLIVCDDQFIDSFSNAIKYNAIDPTLDATLKKVEQVQRKWLLSWLVGHEIGHAVLHDSAGRFSTQLWRHRTVTIALEQEADNFFAEQVPVAERDRANFVLTDFAFQAISFTYTTAASAPGQAVIAPSRDGIHPPWLLRAISIARTVSELQRGAGSSDDFYGGILANIRVAENGADIGTLCSAENLRAQAAERTRQRSSR